MPPSGQVRNDARAGFDMLVGDLMKRPPATISPSETIVAAAVNMREQGTGILMVIENGQLVGVITDHDIVTRCVAGGLSPHDCTVAGVMSRDPHTCRETQTMEEAAYAMGDHQVRRLPVCDAAGTPVGILSLSQIAEHYSEHLAGETLGEIVEARSAPCLPAAPNGELPEDTPDHVRL